FSGEVYGNGMQIGSIILGGPSALIFASYFVLPVLYPLKLTSINEYIDLRFKSKNLRLAVFLPIFLKAVVTSAVALYATSLALTPITKFDNLTNILLLGIICTIYSSFHETKSFRYAFRSSTLLFIPFLPTWGSLIKKKDQILPFFVMDKLSLIPGLPGIFVATVLGGTLSTISSWLNSCVALMWRDVFLKFDFFKSASPSCATLANKIICKYNYFGDKKTKK
ncbi:40S ribosomal protein S11, partial [Armadillidium nasatum]